MNIVLDWFYTWWVLFIVMYLILLYTEVLNKLLVGDDQACLGENVTVIDLSVLATAGYSA